LLIDIFSIIQPYPATQNRYGLIIAILHKINYVEISS